MSESVTRSPINLYWTAKDKISRNSRLSLPLMHSIAFFFSVEVEAPQRGLQDKGTFSSKIDAPSANASNAPRSYKSARMTSLRCPSTGERYSVRRNLKKALLS